MQTYTLDYIKRHKRIRNDARLIPSVQVTNITLYHKVGFHKKKNKKKIETGKTGLQIFCIRIVLFTVMYKPSNDY